MTASVDTAQPGATRSVPFSATVASEWTKLMSLRATYVTVGLCVLLAIVITAIGAIAAGVTWDTWKAEDRADFDPILYTLIGGIFTAILLPILGVKAATAEYSTGMIRLTLTATAKRARVLLAKALVVAVVTFLAGLIATLGMFYTGQIVYASFDLNTASITDWDALRSILGNSLSAMIFPVIGLSLGFILRSTASALTTVLGLMFAPEIVGVFLPSWWHEDILPYLPGPAADTIAIAHLTGESGVHPGVALIILAGWLAAFLAAAYVALARRDA